MLKWPLIDSQQVVSKQPPATGDLQPAILDQAYKQIASIYDATNGGFGGGPSGDGVVASFFSPSGSSGNSGGIGTGGVNDQSPGVIGGGSNSGSSSGSSGHDSGGNLGPGGGHNPPGTGPGGNGSDGEGPNVGPPGEQVPHAAAVPEPASCVLLGVGLGGLAFGASLRRRHARPSSPNKGVTTSR